MPAVPDSFRKKTIRDPLYGFIDVSDLELKIIDTEVFRRLLLIKQLSHAYVVYPTAIHSRFEHSLGTLYIADRMAQELDLNYNERKIVRLTALLHDVGHGPFSHLFESTMRQINPGESSPHEKISQIIINEDPELSCILGDIKNNITDLLNAESEDNTDLLNAESEDNTDLLLTSMISSGLDADKLDYLRRDSYHIGVAYGQFDLARILHNLSVTKKRSSVLVDSGGKDALESYRLARYLMHVQVYEHHARLAADLMFKKALDIAIYEEDVIDKNQLKFHESGKNNNFLKFYKTLNDHSIYQMIIENRKSDVSKKILLNIQRRKLLKRACDFTPDALYQNDDVADELMVMTPEKLDEIGLEIAQSLHLEPHDVIFHKSLIEIKLYNRGQILLRYKNAVKDLNNVSPFLSKDSSVVRYFVYGPADPSIRKSIANEIAKKWDGLKLENISYL